MSIETVTGLLRELSGTGHKVIFYEGEDGSKYGYIPTFKIHQVINKPQPSKLPKPPDKSAIPVILPEESRNPPEVIPVGLEGNGLEGEGIGRDSAPNPEEKKPGKPAHKPRHLFIPPTLEEVKAYIQERGSAIDPELFHAHYTANGWVQGNSGKPVKDWKACVVTWERSNPPGNGRQANRRATDHSRGFFGDKRVGPTDYSKGF
jgi:hypothetical protein